MRNPSLHIKLSHLVMVLTSIGLEQPKKLAEQILTKSVPYSVKDRYLIKGTVEVRKKAAKAVRAAKNASMTVERFNRILDSERRQAGHRAITPIRRGDKQYLLLKEIAQMACEFTHEAKIVNIDEGCRTYVNLGLDFMKRNYALGKFKYYDTQIYSLYEAMDTIANDPKPKRTRRFHDMFKVLLAEYAGIGPDFMKPQDYIHFVFCRLEADKAKADVEDWLRAQFVELDRMFGVVPSTKQLFSDGAVKRYYEYIVKENKLNATDETIISMEYKEPKDDFEKRYAEKLREKYAEK